MLKKLMSLLMLLAATSVLAAPTLSDVKVERVRHGFPWTREYSLDVRFRVSGMKAAEAGFLKGKVRNKVDEIETLLPVRYMRFPSNGVYRVVWNSREKFGSGDVKLALENAVPRGVQLWKGGPCWAETNIGAENPWDAGCYFWWGDTTGYRREAYSWDGKWAASDGSVSWFLFEDLPNSERSERIQFIYLFNSFRGGSTPSPVFFAGSAASHGVAVGQPYGFPFSRRGCVGGPSGLARSPRSGTTERSEESPTALGPV